MITLQDRIAHYEESIRNLWAKRNPVLQEYPGMKEEIRFSIQYSIRRIREYRKRLG